MADSTPQLSRRLHSRHFEACLLGMALPKGYSSLDSSRCTLAYFALAALDLLGAVNDALPKQQIADWIFNLQLAPGSEQEAVPGESYNCGFTGSNFTGKPFDPNAPTGWNRHTKAHIAMMYTSLLMLRLLGDDLSRVNRSGLLRCVREMQLDNGSFRAIPAESESDIRFVFCAAAICHMLGDWSGMDVDRATSFIVQCQTYEGGLGNSPGLEAHGGCTYCGVAALSLMNRLDRIPNRTQLVHYCVQRQVGGFQGRPNKDQDTCYSFWIGGTLQMLGMAHLIHPQALASFNMLCESDEMGGFGKTPDALPDLLHSYLGLAGLSIAGCFDLPAVNASIGVRSVHFPELESPLAST